MTAAARIAALRAGYARRRAQLHYLYAWGILK